MISPRQVDANENQQVAEQAAEEVPTVRPYHASRPPTAGPRTWLLWTGLTTLGYAFNSALSTAIGQSLPGGLLWGTLTGFVGIAMVGLLQWLVLRSHIHRIGWIGWVLTTVVGQIVGVIVVAVAILGPVLFGVLGDLPEGLGASLTQAVIVFAGGCVLGIVIGLAQWLVLLRYLRSAGWWISASGLAQGMAAVILAQNWGLTGVLAVLLVKAIGGLLVGAVTGITLVWLLHRPKYVPADRTQQQYSFAEGTSEGTSYL